MLFSAKLGVIGTFALASRVSAADISCADSFMILVARGSGEGKNTVVGQSTPDFTGIAGSAALKVQQQVPGVVVAGLPYPAALPTADPTVYASSEANGTALVAQTVEDYSQQCPGVPIALMGFSQGAQAVQDAMCGGLGGGILNSLPPMDQSLVEENVLAAVLIADPSQVAGASFNRGNGTRGGIFRRTDTAACDPYAALGIYAAFCQANDLLCDNGTSLAVHIAEPVTFEDDIVQFIVGRWEGRQATAATGANATSATVTKTALSGAKRLSSSQPLLAGVGAVLAVMVLM